MRRCAHATTNRLKSPTRSATWSTRSTRRTGKIKWEREAHKARPSGGTASQEHLRVRNAVHRRRAALRVVRPERRPLLLHAGRHAAVEEAVAAAADLSRLRHRIVADRPRRAASICCTTARPSRTSPRSTRRPARRCGAPPGRATGLPQSSWTTPFVWKNEKRTEIVTIGHAMVISYDLDGKELWRVTGMSMPTASPFVVERMALRRNRLAGRREPAVPRDQARRVGRHHARRRRDQQRFHRLAPSAGLGLHAVRDRARRPCVSGPRHRDPRGARRQDRQGDLQGPRRRRRSHVLGIAGRGR